VWNKTTFKLESDHAAVIVVLPVDGQQEWRNGELWINGVFVAPAPRPVVNILGLKDRQKVNGVLKLKIETGLPTGEHIERISVTLGKTELFSGQELPEALMIDTEEFHNGLMHLRAELEISNGRKDVTEIGLTLDNSTNPLSDPN
jgi:hypothetical protein